MPGSRSRPRLAAVAAVLALTAAPAASAAPIDTLRDLSAALSTCVKPPAGPLGFELTVVFSLKRDGSLLGQPRISHARLKGAVEDQRAFVAGALSALAACLPVPLSRGLGGAVAGRPLSVFIASRPRAIAV